ncbi:hypothetical protein [Sphingomonas corticis]|jgi:hypothetical protein|uniref:Uncharacterized protein n=1 Tax=Sphingomonas corticis TaxID=2722791 RepID=A0ABX1CJQ1_9SPHN|nr:hypothetical protein [Sphingomonas corticis]NJR77619.1 hypothetical protein [Sphingomonas corticis]
MTKEPFTISHGEDMIGVALLLATLIAALFLARIVAGAVIGIGAMMTG